MPTAPTIEAAVSLTPRVRIDPDRRPDSATSVSVADFDGPLGLLLTLIEARHLDVLTVPLGALAGAYLEALATVESDRLGTISSFVTVASQLILIKSRALLPRHQDADATQLDAGELVDPEGELRARLLLYRAHRDAGRRLDEAAQQGGGLFRREPGAAHATALAGARPVDAPSLDVALLVAALDGLAQLAPPPDIPPEAMARSVTLTERADVIRAALQEATSIVLQDLLRGVRDRTVMAVTFLAMLELVKRREIVVEQAEPFGPIIARGTTPEERSGSGGADAPDEPLDDRLESFA
ncbi:MAG: segregation/condensation protein A [Chloroflexota bacterium]